LGHSPGRKASPIGVCNRSDITSVVGGSPDPGSGSQPLGERVGSQLPPHWRADKTTQERAQYGVILTNWEEDVYSRARFGGWGGGSDHGSRPGVSIKQTQNPHSLMRHLLIENQYFYGYYNKVESG
jgi:hypothetical protein